MKKTGMTRPVDELGRVVIPKEIRTSLQIDVKDRLEILLDGEYVIDIQGKQHPRNATEPKP